MHKPEIMDIDLARSVAKNDVVAQKILFTRYSGRMMAVCLRYADSREEAEDVLQEGFITVFNKIGQYKGAGSLEGWVRSIMIRLSLRNWKKKKSFVIEPLESHFELHADSISIIDQLNTKELLHMIASLPEGYRMVFNLFVIDGYSHAEIALIMGIQESTSRSQLVKARLQLQKMILKNNSDTITSIYKGDENKR